MNAWEQPLLRVHGLPVAAQDLQQHGREHHVPVIAAFALLNADNHPSGDTLRRAAKLKTLCIMRN
jgi:hypothetical protein